jgi:hypothetical protein
MTDPKFIHSRYLQELQDKIAAFNERTFPGQTVHGVANHLAKEAGELAAEPGDLMEQADVLILLLQVCHKQGVSGSELLRNAFTKVEINEKRDWPKEPAEDGTFQHTKESRDGGEGGEGKPSTINDQPSAITSHDDIRLIIEALDEMKNGLDRRFAKMAETCFQGDAVHEVKAKIKAITILRGRLP